LAWSYPLRQLAQRALAQRASVRNADAFSGEGQRGATVYQSAAASRATGFEPLT